MHAHWLDLPVSDHTSGGAKPPTVVNIGGELNSASVTAVLWAGNSAFWSSQRREGSGALSANACLDVGWSLESMLCHITLLLDQSLIMPWEGWHLPSHEAQKPPDQRPGSLCRSLMCNLLRLPCAVTERENHSGLVTALAAALLWLSFLHWCHSRRLVCLLPGSSSLFDPSHSSPQGIHPFSWLFLYLHRVQGQSIIY